MKVLGIIPARYSSLRFPGKPLVDIAGKSMIQRVYEQAIKCKDLNKVLVATDDDKIFNHVKLFNGNVIITSSNHQSGTDRCAEAVEKIGEDYDIIINIQGDEPTINPFQISSLIELLKNSKQGIGTLYKKIKSQKELDDLNTVKLIFNDDFEAINFFRENLFDKLLCNKHIGMYGFRKETLMKITMLPLSINEKKHNLEQLRWLDNNYKIKVLETKTENISIDTIDDLKKLLNNTKF
jgi:3-deoxy-manno-octulosonate cytidylyltransferase (CMP-KDO synthetase)|tara:strand:+ start:36 stop:746 length:711 start_codon:yes stop_codon:yes gene_type:complete